MAIIDLEPFFLNPPSLVHCACPVFVLAIRMYLLYLCLLTVASLKILAAGFRISFHCLCYHNYILHCYSVISLKIDGIQVNSSNGGLSAASRKLFRFQCSKTSSVSKDSSVFVISRLQVHNT